jgi:sortase A
VTPRRTNDDLSAEELRRLLVEKRRADREVRLERFRRSGRVIQPAETDFEIGESLSSSRVRRSDRRSRRRRWLDHVLLFVEIAAVLGLAYVLFNGVSLMRNLNKEASSAMAQPTLTPTAIIQAVVLPSGHTPPNSAEGVRFNEAEIPEHLRPLAQTMANLPIPTPGTEQAVRIQIPALDFDAPVVQGDGWEQLKKGVGQHLGTPDPGQNGNLVFSAHNDVYGEIFRHLDRLQSGDEVIVYTNQRAFVYKVAQTQIVEPTRVDVMAPTQEPVVTLISCYPYLVDNQRIVITASLSEER